MAAGKKVKDDEWQTSEDLRLEHAFRVYRLLPEAEKWVNISEVVESKGPEECKKRCVALS